VSCCVIVPSKSMAIRKRLTDAGWYQRPGRRPPTNMPGTRTAAVLAAFDPPGPSTTTHRTMTAPRPIFIHGAIAGSAVWKSLSDRFDGAAVLALPGHPNGAAITDESELVGWIALAIAQLEGSRVLIGHGLGALLALEVARRHPEVLEGAVMLGGGPRLHVPDLGEEVHADTASRLLTASMREPGGDLGDALADAIGAIAPQTLATDLAMSRRLEVGATAGELRCPVLIVVGEQDVWAPPHEAAELAAALPRSHMIVVAQAGHLVQADAPDTTALLVAAFLARVELTLAEQ
jgi:pimeloyl-ACP methyl ester carboxylesterase